MFTASGLFAPPAAGPAACARLMTRPRSTADGAACSRAGAAGGTGGVVRSSVIGADGTDALADAAAAGLGASSLPRRAGAAWAPVATGWPAGFADSPTVERAAPMGAGSRIWGLGEFSSDAGGVAAAAVAVAGTAIGIGTRGVVSI